MTDNLQITSFEVPQTDLYLVKEAFAKLAKKADKLGVPAPVITYGPKIIKEKKNDFGRKYSVEIVPVTIEGGPVKLSGYDFLASVEHTKEGNFITTRPAATVDERFRTSDCYCDHCKINRDRKKLYIFADATGQQYQIGSTCLKDFFGHSPAAVAFAAEWDSVLKNIEDESWGRSGGNRSIDLVAFTATCAAVIDHEGGYVSLKAAGDDFAAATTTKVQIALWPNKDAESQKYSAQIKKQLEADNYWTKAEEAIRYIREDWKDTSDYAWNLKVITKLGYFLQGKMFNIAASLWPTYQRQMGYLKEKELKRKLEETKAAASEFVGTLGERIKGLAATVTMAQYIKSGDWGDTYLYKFTTDKGEILTWFSSPHGLNKGDKVFVTGTVKEHCFYQGHKETQLTRCKVY